MNTTLMKLFFSVILIFLQISKNFSQSKLTIDSINALVNNSPSFTINKDNYFITGIPMNAKATGNNSDAKFQFSFKQRLANGILPYSLQMYLSYTQKSFWNIYKDSKPFAETNYNPCLGFTKFFVKGNKIMGATIAFEHESNGRDGLNSRSWNRIALNFAVEATKRSRFYFNFWIPFLYEEDNPTLLDYTGKAELAYQWHSLNNRFAIDLTVRKGDKFDWRGSVQTQFSYRMDKRENQFLTLQFFNGYAESLIEYQTIKHMVRAGIMIKPSKFVFY
jgi:phospholipase A1/A2